ncbi:tetratricopeptide repeat protein [Parvibaculum sp.]|uniref:tetratricopeptide repeat protein n=2 Tax=Parvibaculum sp. TaxID=2024848 RepID=UPI0027321B14|nr:tetratricopeptide repeat protein [Parvibaculum sp.]MDP1627858.1 tetratricopeptide repeat protein [Parvibaculum sp.]MDP3329708.1 tetratricopeptide repeat protein [Parvibaculum sp.]
MSRDNPDRPSGGRMDELLAIAGLLFSQLGDALGPYANIVQIASSSLVTLSTCIAVFRRWRRNDKAVIARLERDVQYRTDQLDRAKTELLRLQDRETDLSERLPEDVLDKAGKELDDENYDRANRLIQNWLAVEGEPLSRLFFSQADWAARHATGELRQAGLTVAEAFATASLVSDPGNREARELHEDLRQFRILEHPGAPLPLAATLGNFNDNLPDLKFEEDAVEYAFSLQSEASDMFRRGHYLIAFKQLDEAVRILSSQIGRDALPTLHVRQVRAEAMSLLGNYADANVEIGKIIALRCRLQGEDHPDTLWSRHLQAELLLSLGRAAEALEMIREVIEKRAADPSLGPDHPDTRASRYLQVRTLEHLGRNAEALEMIGEVIEKNAADPSLGPDHPHTLSSRHQQVRILERLGRNAEALEMIGEVIEKRAADPSLGPDHPHTLLSRQLQARVLLRLGRAAEALEVVEEVLRLQAAHPSLGPDHPDTIESRELYDSLRQAE